MTGPVLSVVIPSRDGAERLGETLASIATQESPGPIEVIVVDDGSSDATSAVASAAHLPWGPPRVVRHEVPRARAAACNSGITAAGADLILILDDDMTLGKGSLHAHLEFHAAHGNCAALGRILLAPARPAGCFDAFLEAELKNREASLLAARDDVPFPLCLTGHFSAPREILRAAGGYDARIQTYGFEDIDLGFRLASRGVRLAYLPQATSIHRAYTRDLRRYLSRHFEEGRTARALAARHPSGPLRAYLRVDGPAKAGPGSRRPGLAALRAANWILVKRGARRLLSWRPVYAAFRAGIRCAEALRLTRLAHFAYRVAGDLHYFRGVFGEREPGAPS